MKRNSKSRDSKSYNSELGRKEFYACYEALKKYDAECVHFNHASEDEIPWSLAQNNIDELEKLQRNIIIHMIAINADLKIRDKAVDAYLQHLVFVLGL